MAAQIGVQALRDGGNAYDAAVAAALAETVLQPPKCGLAGDLVAISHGAGRGVQALVSIGGAAAALADAVRRDGGLPATGALSAGVPGAPAGYAALAERGRLGLPRLAEPARDLALRGFVWTRVVDVLTHESQDLLRRENPDGCVFLPGDAPPVEGSVMRLPGLARLLERYAQAGGSLFAGEPGRVLCAEVARRGGVLTEADLTTPTAEWCEPVEADVDGVRLYATPAPTHGPSLLEAVRQAGRGASTLELWQTVRDVARARASTLGDPRGGGGTSVVGAADADGNTVVIVHSNSFPRYGSGIVVPDYDLVVSNRAGRGFSAVEGHPNFPASGRRPATTLHAWAFDRRDGADGSVMLGATHGGENQMPWNAQLLVRMLAGSAPADAMLAPLWQVETAGDALTVERDLPDDDKRALSAAGARLSESGSWTLRSGFQLVTAGPAGPTAISDLRTIGAAAAW
ncbi:MAG TPA: gamma-glutamyltransferase [Mycobacteriales bacterium]|nr:gamma-glutamyltransferase [Mycobacteriales bacterium]